MQKLYEAGFRDEILFAEKDGPWELILMDIATDRSSVFMENFSDLLSGVEIEVKTHSLIPNLSFICFRSSGER